MNFPETETQAYHEIWSTVCRMLENSIAKPQILAWIQPLVLQSLQGQKTTQGEDRTQVLLIADQDFRADWVRDHHKKAIQGAFEQVLGSPCEILVQVAQGQPNPDIFEETPEYRGIQAPQAQTTMRPASPAFSSSHEAPPRVSFVARNSYQENTPDARYTFGNFVVGSSNNFAFASAMAVADKPAKQYNPLFLYSPPGLGKTHLLHGIGNQFLDRNPQGRVAYLSAEKFVNELIDSLQHRKMGQFRAKYRDSYDLILVDDIQFIAGKKMSEEEFFHTFNALHLSGRQIVLSSDRPPKEIQGLEERIRTRFEWGLVADIQPPEIETRIAILKAKAERDDIYLPDDVATFLASCVKTNVRELEGVLIKLQAQASLTGAEISLELAKRELRNHVPEDGPHFTVESIQDAVAKHFGLRVVDLKSTSRAQKVAFPRQIAMFLIRKYANVRYQEIGSYFGGKDHSTIMHACQKIEHGIESEPRIRDAVESVQNLL